MYYYDRSKKNRPTTPFDYAILCILILSILFVISFLIWSVVNVKNRTDLIQETRESIEIEEKDGKIVLNDALLRSDYAAWYSVKQQGNTYMTLLMIFIFVLILSTVGCSIGSSLYLKKRGIESNMDRRRISTLAAMVICLTIILIASKMILSMDYPKPEEAVLFVQEYKITNKETVKKRKAQRNYYLYTDNGRKLKVDKTDYEKVTKSGTYYFGVQTSTIFNVYPKEEYCRDES